MLTAIDPAAIAQRVDLSPLTAHASLELRAVNEAAVRRQIEAVVLEVVQEVTGRTPEERVCLHCTETFMAGAGRLFGSMANSLYCSQACRSAAYRERKKQREEQGR